MDDANSLAMLQSLGLQLPTPAYLVGVIAFSIVGMVAFWAGRRAKRARTKWLGLALMLYPYVIWQTAWLYVVGLALCFALWWFRRD